MEEAHIEILLGLVSLLLMIFCKMMITHMVVNDLHIKFQALFNRFSGIHV